MPFQSVPQCASIEIVFQQVGVTVENQLHAKFPGAYDQSNLDDLAADIDAAVGALYLPMINNSTEYITTHVKGLEFLIDQEAFDGTHSGFGAQTSLSEPGNVTVALTMRTGHTGRSARGRAYLVGLYANAHATPNTVTGAYQTLANALGAGLIVAAAAHGWALGVVSRFTAGAPRVTGTFLPATDFSLRNLTYDSQRGRLPQGH